jgi:hypothetical protein
MHRGGPTKVRVAHLDSEPINPRELYKRILNLKKIEDIEKFLQHRLFTMPSVEGNPIKATVVGIQNFQKDLHYWLKSRIANKFADHITTYAFSEDSLKQINKYLNNCRPTLLSHLVTDKDPNIRETQNLNEKLAMARTEEKEELQKQRIEKINTLSLELIKLSATPEQKQGIEAQIKRLRTTVDWNKQDPRDKNDQLITEYAFQKNQSYNPRRTGGFFHEWAIIGTDSLSICAYGFVEDILAGESIKICSCGNIFISKKGQKYCLKTDCTKARQRVRANKSRLKEKN